MTNHTNPNSNNSEEIDIIQFFSYIGRGIGNFFRAIGKAFAAVFHVFILLLILVQKNLYFFIGALVIGIVAGTFLDSMKEPSYEAEMVVEPNYASAKQLYTQIDFFNGMALAGDTVSLAKALTITPREAGCIRSISIKPLVDEKQKLELYDEFIKTLDTLTQKSFDYASFSANFSDQDAKYQTIKVRTVRDNTIPRKIEKSIVASVTNNIFFETQKEIRMANFAFQDSVYKKQLTEIDSLLKTYREALIASAQNTSPSQTNINLSERTSSNNKQIEVEMLDKIDAIRYGIVSLNEKKGIKKSTLNIVAEFPEKALRIKSLSSTLKVTVPLALMFLLLLVLLLIKLNNYLRSYSKE